ncbi:cytochrome c [sulfur-oxidizing endosymbiont of Gigantopelta aegis]|uniref:cytochrome c n=1 Tax=sulfur-oxidizing endosymbiont of Gigantopelta aegis TaxID=2794934 RepID=UPI0018DCF583|nr:cytochrome c [sulfur-oxidizing endosymbiont of Gigantopelta aegis]
MKKPPEALTQWYKPANKRQVWLHTMFRLRREVLAMKDYAAKGQQPELEKWSQKFAKDYRSIAEMVPQWEEYLYVDKLTQLQTLVKQQDYAAIPAQLKKISKSCMHCHDDFQTVSTLLYRTPDFSTQTIPQGHDEVALDYDEMMEHLSDSVNRINIAIKDGYYTDAHQAIAPLDKQLQALASHCSSCHKQDKQPIERIMSASRDLLAELAAQLQHQDKKAGRKLGEFAVKVCARCHAVHRLTADLKSIAE